MAGTGFNYIREIMQMNLPEESTPKELMGYERAVKEKAKFHFIGLTPYEPFDNNCTVRLMPAGMSGVIAVNKSELIPYNAEVNDVVQFCGRLLVFTERRHWAQFVPGPCTNYDGPNPYEKTVYAITGEAIDSPLAKAIRENLKRSLEANSAIGFCELIPFSANEIVAKYDIKYIGETFTDVRKYHDNRVVWLHHPIRVYNQVRHEANIGEMVEYNGLRYVWNGNQWVEMPETDKVALGWPKTNKEENNMAVDIRYLGESELRIYEGSKNGTVKINGKHMIAKSGDIVMSDGELYAFAPTADDRRIAWRHISAITLGDGGPVFCYNKVKPNWLTIDKVVFNAPATIVLWKDGTKTIVKCGDNEVFDPEKGLAMAITKKAFGNQGNYYNQIKKLLPEPKENNNEVLTLKESLNRIFGDPKIEDAKKKLSAVQELICDMALRGATKAELMRAIRFSKDLIDVIKGRDLDIDKSVEALGIIELEAKYQPKK